MLSSIGLGLLNGHFLWGLKPKFYMHFLFPHIAQPIVTPVVLGEVPCCASLYTTSPTSFHRVSHSDRKITSFILSLGSSLIMEWKLTLSYIGNIYYHNKYTCLNFSLNWNTMLQSNKWQDKNDDVMTAADIYMLIDCSPLQPCI